MKFMDYFKNSYEELLENARKTKAYPETAFLALWLDLYGKEQRQWTEDNTIYYELSANEFLVPSQVELEDGAIVTIAWLWEG